MLQVRRCTLQNRPVSHALVRALVDSRRFENGNIAYLSTWRTPAVQGVPGSAVKFRDNMYAIRNASSKSTNLKGISIAMMSASMARDELLALNAEINALDKSYYQDDMSLISDTRYDRVVRRAEDLIGKFPDLSELIDKFHRVGYQKKSSSKPFLHSTQLLSLANAFTEAEILDFLKKSEVKLQKKHGADSAFVCKYVIEPKIDGLSLALHYISGCLVGAGTRGNGHEGENVLENVDFVHGIPKTIIQDHWETLGSHSGDFEVRGEVYISKFDFEELNKDRTLSNQALMSTTRNTAAGALRQLDSSKMKKCNLRFFAYCLLVKAQEDVPFSAKWVSVREEDQDHALEQLKLIGFSVAEPIVVATNPTEVVEACKALGRQRASLPYDTDGAVIKVSNVLDQQYLGNVSRYPNWAIAYKFSADEAETKLLGIDVHVGRTGVLTPVARLEPVRIGGVLVSRATLHSEREIAKLRIEPGKGVRLKRAGDVIPKILGPSLQQDSTDDYMYNLPANCPVCNSVTEKLEGGAVVRCTGFMKCSAQAIEHICHFCSRDAFDINGLGHSKIEELYSTGIIKSVAGIFRLRETDRTPDADTNGAQGPFFEGGAKQSDFSNLRLRKGWGDRSVNNLLAAVDAKRSIPFHRFLYALGIRHVGLETSKLIAGRFGQFSDLLKYLTGEALHDSPHRGKEILSLPGVGPKVVDSLLRTMSDPHQRQIIDDLLREVNVESAVDTLKASAIKRNTVIFTGKLRSMTRSEAETLCLSKQSIDVSSRITKSTTVLISESLEKVSAKLLKARALGILVMNEQEFVDWVEKQP